MPWNTAVECGWVCNALSPACPNNSNVCIPLVFTQNRKGAVSELEHIPDAVLCDVHSHDGVVIAG